MKVALETEESTKDLFRLKLLNGDQVKKTFVESLPFDENKLKEDEKSTGCILLEKTLYIFAQRENRIQCMIIVPDINSSSFFGRR